MADALVDLDEFPGEFLKTTALGDLPPGVADSAGGDGSLLDLVPDVTLEEPGGAMSRIVVPGAAAVRLPALAEAGEQVAGTEVSDPAQFLAEGVAAMEKVVEVVGGHAGASCVCPSVRMSDTLEKSKGQRPCHKYVVHPRPAVLVWGTRP